jgi:predicted enzyme related to lactoylglutathione lyase
MGGGWRARQAVRHRHYVHAKDPAATLRRVEELGGRVVMPLTEVAGVAKDTTIASSPTPRGTSSA